MKCEEGKEKVVEGVIEDCGGIQMPDPLPPKVVELVFVLDASGSMHGLESDTIGGVNAVLEEQKKIQNGATMYVSTVIFNVNSCVLHDRVDIDSVEPLSVEKYAVGGCTALYDALGDAICHISNIHKYARKEDVPQKTMFVIMTDGMENASRRYGQHAIKNLIERKQQVDGWEFIFLAANIDAGDAAECIGIDRKCAVDWHADGDGVQILHGCVNACAENMRAGRGYDRGVFAAADADFCSRKKGEKKGKKEGK